MTVISSYQLTYIVFSIYVCVKGRGSVREIYIEREREFSHSLLSVILFIYLIPYFPKRLNQATNRRKHQEFNELLNALILLCI